MKKKQPTKVLLSKEDLVELLTVLKNFMGEEIKGYSRVTTHRMDCHNRRIVELEIGQKRQESNQILHCTHEDRFDSVWYSSIKTRFYCLVGVRYKCRWCSRIRTVLKSDLSRRMKKTLYRLGIDL